MITGGRPSALC